MYGNDNISKGRMSIIIPFLIDDFSLKVMPGAVRKPHYKCQFKKNNRLGPRSGRFGFLTEPDFE